MATRAKQTRKKPEAQQTKKPESVKIPELTTSKLLQILAHQEVTQQILNIFADGAGIDLGAKKYNLVGDLYLTEVVPEEGPANEENK